MDLSAMDTSATYTSAPSPPTHHGHGFVMVPFIPYYPPTHPLHHPPSTTTTTPSFVVEAGATTTPQLQQQQPQQYIGSTPVPFGTYCAPSLAAAYGADPHKPISRPAASSRGPRKSEGRGSRARTLGDDAEADSNAEAHASTMQQIIHLIGAVMPEDDTIAMLTGPQSNSAMSGGKSSARPAVSAGAHINYAWRDLSEVSYERFPGGHTLRIAPPNSKAASDVMDAQLVLKTRALTCARRPLTHCAHYYFNRSCNLGAECQFVHAVYLDPNARPGQRAPMPSKLGDGRELQLSRKQREARRALTEAQQAFTRSGDQKDDGKAARTDTASPSSVTDKSAATVPSSAADDESPASPSKHKDDGSKWLKLSTRSESTLQCRSLAAATSLGLDYRRDPTATLEFRVAFVSL